MIARAVSFFREFSLQISGGVRSGRTTSTEGPLLKEYIIPNAEIVDLADATEGRMSRRHFAHLGM